MPILRTGFTLVAAALLASSAAVATAQGSVSAAQSAPTPTRGIAKLQVTVDLPPGVWTDTPLEIKLPRAGTYELDADVRGRLSGAPPLNTFVTARLWNVTSGAEVPESTRIVNQVIDINPGAAYAGHNQTASIHELIRVAGPTTIRLQARGDNAYGAADIAQIRSDGQGYTTLRYSRVGR
jgi:hypothetical protein